MTTWSKSDNHQQIEQYEMIEFAIESSSRNCLKTCQVSPGIFFKASGKLKWVTSKKQILKNSDRNSNCWIEKEKEKSWNRQVL